jgi:hypothetical protein
VGDDGPVPAVHHQVAEGPVPEVEARLQAGLLWPYAMFDERCVREYDDAAVWERSVEREHQEAWKRLREILECNKNAT